MDSYQTSRFSLPKSKVLKKSSEIREVLHSGTKLSGKSVNIFIKLANKSKFAILVPKRIGVATKRNRMKRLIREIYRRNPHWFENNEAIFFVKRFNDSYAILEKEICRLVTEK